MLSPSLAERRRQRAHRLLKKEWWARRKRAFAHPTIRVAMAISLYSDGIIVRPLLRQVCIVKLGWHGSNRARPIVAALSPMNGHHCPSLPPHPT